MCSSSVSGRGFSGMCSPRPGGRCLVLPRVKDGGGGTVPAQLVQTWGHGTALDKRGWTLGHRPVDTQLHALKEPWTADPRPFQKARPPTLPSTALLTALPYPHSTPAQIPPPLPSPQLPKLGSRPAFASWLRCLQPMSPKCWVRVPASDSCFLPASVDPRISR